MTNTTILEALTVKMEEIWNDDLSFEDQAAAVLELVGPRPLVWGYVSDTHTLQAQSPYGEYSVGFDDGWWGQLIGNMPWEWEPDCDPRTYDGPDEAQAAAQAHADAAHWANTQIGGE